MPMRKIWEYDASANAARIVADGNVELPPYDLSSARALKLEVLLTGTIATNASDLLNIYLQSRGQANVWGDRIAADQLNGGMSDGECREYNVLRETVLSGTEEAREPSGSTGGSHITAGSVRNGPFPGRYMATGLKPATGWRIQFDITHGGSETGAFPVKLFLYADMPE